MADPITTFFDQLRKRVDASPEPITWTSAADLVIGLQSHAILAGRHDTSQALKRMAEEETDLWEDVVAHVRASMPDLAFPVSFRARVVSGWGRDVYSLNEIEIRVANLEEPVAQLTHHWSGFAVEKDSKSLADVAEDMTLISRMLRPTNQPVQAWSTVCGLMTARGHSSSENVHARTEIEALIKLLYARKGRAGLDKLIETRDLTMCHRDDSWMTAVPLQGFDKNPLGIRATIKDISTDFAEMFEYSDLNTSQEEPSC